MSLLHKDVEIALIFYLLTCELNITLNTLITKIAPGRIGFNISLLESIEQIANVCGPVTWALTLELVKFRMLAAVCIALGVTTVCMISAT